MENKVNVNRGDIFFAVLSGEGSVQRGRRPVVVISNEKNNTHSNILNVVPCTTKIKKLPVHANLSMECGLKQKSQALCEQVYTITKDSLENFVGRATDNDLREINKALAIQMGLYREGESLLSFFIILTQN